MDPPEEYKSLREEAPAKKVRLYDGREAWIFTRMADVKELLQEPSFSANPATPGYPFLTASRAVLVKSYKTFIMMDPPDHGHFRRMLTRDFTHKRMEELRPRLEVYVETLFDALEQQGTPADFIKHVALKLPVTVVSYLVGIPDEDNEKLVQWSTEMLDLAIDPAVTDAAAKAMYTYFDESLKRKQGGPLDENDMLSRLAKEQVATGNMTHAEAVRMIVLLYVAGHETTANQIGLGTLSFLQDDRQRAMLQTGEANIRLAVEEMLRFHTPVHLNSCRVATKDVEIAGVTVKAGEGIYPLLIAANRDPNMFGCPDAFDITRGDADKHVAFSYGIHQCLGQPLARLELQVMFGKLFNRFPNLRLAIPFEDIEFKRDMYVYGIEALPISW